MTAATWWLAIDTATATAGVALHDGVSVAAEVAWSGRRRSVDLAPILEAMLRREGLAPGDVAGIAVAIGPGSFTGLRVGLGLAKGMALGLGVPLVGVPTLDVLAAPFLPPFAEPGPPLWAVIDAGRGRIVAACYAPGTDSAGLGDTAASPPPSGPFAPEAPAAWAARARPPARVVGEVDAATRAAAAAAGLAVLPPAAGLRRAGWLAELGRRRWTAGDPGDPDVVAPIYLDTPAGP